MLLSKEFAVYLNLAACKLKQYSAVALKKNGVGLTPEQFLLVDLLWNHGPMTQQALANLMQKDKNSITKIVDGLEKKALVERRKNMSDRRSNYVVLTPKSEAMKIEAKEKGISLLDDVLEGISDEELKSFLATLEKILQNMDS